MAALVIGRVASEETLGRWVRLARSVTVRELRAAARRARGRGSNRPPDDGDDEPGARESPDAAPADPALADPPCLVRMSVPAAVSAVFDETLDLYRAVVGSEATVTSFIDALVGEARSGPGIDDEDADSPSPFPVLPGGIQVPPLSHGLGADRREAIWARATSGWLRLREDADAEWAMALAGVELSTPDAAAARGSGRRLPRDDRVGVPPSGRDRADRCRRSNR